MQERTTPDAVTWAYRLFLEREPESESIVAEHISNSPELRTLRDVFIGSAEFHAKAPPRLVPALRGDEPVRVVDTGGEAGLLARLFDHVNESWLHLGETDPFWSVLTAPEFRGEPSEEDVRRFFDSGAREVERLCLALERNGLRLDGRGTCLEYGCGLGRVTRHLVPLFSRTIGVDISSAHLKLADERAQRDGVDNVEWWHLSALDALDQLPQVDFIYSVIVLQHNPPPVIDRVLTAFARILRPGGIAMFQVPTYRADYEFRLEDYLKHQVGRLEMEMHAFPQSRVFEIFFDAGARPVSVIEDGATGNRRGERSNTFIFTKAR